MVISTAKFQKQLNGRSRFCHNPILHIFQLLTKVFCQDRIEKLHKLGSFWQNLVWTFNFFEVFTLETTFGMSISLRVLELKFQYWLHPNCQIRYNVYRHSALWCWNSTTKKLKTQPAGHTEYILQGVLTFLWFFLICMIVLGWNHAEPPPGTHTFSTYLSSLVGMIAIVFSNQAQKWGQICCISVQLERAAFFRSLLFSKLVLSSPPGFKNHVRFLLWRIFPGLSPIWNFCFSNLFRKSFILESTCQIYIKSGL